MIQNRNKIVFDCFSTFSLSFMFPADSDVRVSFHDFLVLVYIVGALWFCFIFMQPSWSLPRSSEVPVLECCSYDQGGSHSLVFFFLGSYEHVSLDV